VAGFESFLKTVLTLAREEALRDGSATAEAHHLLLAVAGHPGAPAASVLASAGLDRAAIRQALDREFAQSLGAVGVSPSAFSLPPATPDPQRRPHLGASIPLTLERATKAAAGTRPQPAHLLVGILQADVGTVPRALALAGVDRAGLLARARQAAT